MEAVELLLSRNTEVAAALTAGDVADQQVEALLAGQPIAFQVVAQAGHLALQVSLAGRFAHGIGGFDKDKARAALDIPEG